MIVFTPVCSGVFGGPETKQLFKDTDDEGTSQHFTEMTSKTSMTSWTARMAGLRRNEYTLLMPEGPQNGAMHRSPGMFSAYSLLVIWAIGIISVLLYSLLTRTA